MGSSNLDPLSLSLNLEANVIIQDRAFNAQLHRRLSHLMNHSCRQVQASPSGPWEGLRLLPAMRCSTSCAGSHLGRMAAPP